LTFLILSLVPAQVRKLRNNYNLTKQRPQLFLAVTDAGKAAVLARSKLEVRMLGAMQGTAFCSSTS
jgi:hypothetical protein